MLMLILACGLFLGIHLFISGTSFRARLIAVMGEKTYMGMFSLLSVVALGWMIHAYGTAEPVQLWGQVQQMRIFALVFVFIAFLFIVPGMLTPNPTGIGGERMISGHRPLQGITRITRHPFLIGVALWSATHVIYNGDAPSLVFFGTFFCLALIGPLLIDRKQRALLGEDWRHFAETTSVTPFLAIIQGRNRFKLMDLGWWRILAALLVYGLFAHFHETLFGVAPMVRG